MHAMWHIMKVRNLLDGKTWFMSAWVLLVVAGGKDVSLFSLGVEIRNFPKPKISSS